MNKYEILYIINNNVEDEARREAVVTRFQDLVTENGGSVENVDNWGLKKFAYPINYKNDGYYVLMNFSCEPSFIKEMERQMRNADEIVRYMTIRK